MVPSPGELEQASAKNTQPADDKFPTKCPPVSDFCDELSRHVEIRGVSHTLNRYSRRRVNNLYVLIKESVAGVENLARHYRKTCYIDQRGME
jgi:hypothetical protein